MSQTPPPPQRSLPPQQQQQPQQPQQPIPLFDPKTIKAASYPNMIVVVLVVWCFGGIILTMMGSAITDWTGTLLTIAEAVFILTRDRVGFYTGAGFWKVDEWSSGQRTALAIAEIPLWFVALMLYVVRLAALYYQNLNQPAPLTPPAKRKRPQR